MKKTSNFFHELLGTIIYWLHAGLMTLFFVSGFIVSLKWVVFVYLLIQLQLYIFQGCGVTKLQQKLGYLESDEDFIPALLKRFFKIRITEWQHGIISFLIMSFPVVVGLAKSF